VILMFECGLGMLVPSLMLAEATAL